MVKLFGEAEAQRLVAASEQAVFDIANFCLEHGIDADLRLGGAVYAASNRAQLGSLDGVLAALAKVGRNRWQPLDDAATRAASGSPAMQAGFITDAVERLATGQAGARLAAGGTGHGGDGVRTKCHDPDCRARQGGRGNGAGPGTGRPGLCWH
ncbi:hypothetical protein [Paludibacterium denitrificans]|uniref:hypothetical protein n=1 Tax=Paludibacterium denitrificans TaxID=2675226 RepID=UPI001E3D804B|nr:hypothetical protein [Paludibacterium denitrificans]